MQARIWSKVKGELPKGSLEQNADQHVFRIYVLNSNSCSRNIKTK